MHVPLNVRKRNYIKFITCACIVIEFCGALLNGHLHYIMKYTILIIHNKVNGIHGKMYFNTVSISILNE